jgi:hypothetical protein
LEGHQPSNESALTEQRPWLILSRCVKGDARMKSRTTV